MPFLGKDEIEFVVESSDPPMRLLNYSIIIIYSTDAWTGEIEDYSNTLLMCSNGGVDV